MEAEPAAETTDAPMTRGELALDLGSRIAAASALSWFSYRTVHALIDQGFELALVLQLVAQILPAVLVMVARRTRQVDRSPASVIATWGGTFYLFFVAPDAGHALVPGVAVYALQVSGIAMNLWAKIFLGRSFGLLPANRGVVVAGPYRLVRHPMYLGYFVSDLGFLLARFSPWNLGVHLVYFAFQIARTIREDRLLRQDPKYRAYAEQVRWRIVPGVF